MRQSGTARRDDSQRFDHVKGWSHSEAMHYKYFVLWRRSHEEVGMENLGKSLGDRREHLLQRELEVVQAAIERAAAAREESAVSKDWWAKLWQWRDELKSSLRRLPDWTA